MARRISKQALNELDKLGSDKSQFDTEGLLDGLEQIAGNFIQRVQDNLSSSDSIVTGGIAEISIVRNGDTLEIHGNKWLIFQDKGVNGSVVKRYDTPFSYKDKKPPVQDFIEWVKSRNIQTRNNEQFSGNPQSFKEASDQRDVESIAYAIREKVFKEGIKPKNVYSKELPGLADEVKEYIKDFTLQSIKEQLNNKK